MPLRLKAILNSSLSIWLWGSSMLFYVAEVAFFCDSYVINSCIHIPQFISYSTLNKRLNCFQFGAITNILLWMNILWSISDAKKYAFLLGIYFKVQLFGHGLCAHTVLVLLPKCLPRRLYKFRLIPAMYGIYHLLYTSYLFRSLIFLSCICDY